MYAKTPEAAPATTAYSEGYDGLVGLAITVESEASAALGRAAQDLQDRLLVLGGMCH